MTDPHFPRKIPPASLTSEDFKFRDLLHKDSQKVEGQMKNNHSLGEFGVVPLEDSKCN
jgi:hypothetical protein